MKFHLEIRTEARLEIFEAFLYYEDKRDNLGEEFLNHMGNYFDWIRKNPDHFPIKRRNYREAYVKRFPYLIIYEVVQEKVIVYSVFNTYQDPKKKIK
ncbi:MAG TPA: type II toxin-antitoxin system RelE/ParE family toxin [Flavobacteriaceae bacterium]|nr:type II toxin-antitoxin system RelE/ParE family toxin [Flavobacteriaceae bacterium]